MPYVLRRTLPDGDVQFARVQGIATHRAYDIRDATRLHDPPAFLLRQYNDLGWIPVEVSR